MTAIDKITITCPCCGHTFQSPTWGTRNTFGTISSDLHFGSLGYDYLPLEIHTCDQCGYSLDNRELETGDQTAYSVTPELQERIRQQILQQIKPKFPPSPKRYEFAALISEWRGDSFYRIGEHYLKAAWCSDERREYDDAMNYRRKALVWFEKELRGNPTSPDYDRPVLMYQVGELHRRTGNTERAVYWLNQVEEAVLWEGKHFWLIDLAARQRDHPEETIEDPDSIFNDETLGFFDKLCRRCCGIFRIYLKKIK